MTKIVVGSKNPPKIEAVKKVFSKYFEEIEVIGVEVKSGVSDQPLSEEETYKGALNRAWNALRVYPVVDFVVGIEGGIGDNIMGTYEKTIVVVLNKDGEVGIGISPALFLPNKITHHIKKGNTLSDAIDHYFGTKDIGKSIGAYGVFTNGVVTRSKGMEHAIAFALSRFLETFFKLKT